MDKAEVIDVTFVEQLAGQGESWHEGLELGLEFSGKRVAQLTLDLAQCRTKIVEAEGAAEQRERLLAHWKAEAQWWREEHDKVHAEFCEFAKAVERKFCR